MSDIICDQDSFCYQRFSSEQYLPFERYQMHLKCHELMSSDALYLLALLTNCRDNSVDPDQQQSI